MTARTLMWMGFNSQRQMPLFRLRKTLYCFMQPDGWLKINGYCPELAECFKIVIPSKDRRWFPSEECWRINGKYLDWLRKAVNVSVARLPRHEAYKILDISPNASPELIKAKYREKVMKYHPDRYKGRSNMMLLLNWAYDTLLS